MAVHLEVWFMQWLAMLGGDDFLVLFLLILPLLDSKALFNTPNCLLVHL